MKSPLFLPAFCLLFLLIALPGTAETTEKIRSHQTLEAAVLNQNLPLEKRIKALKTLLSGEMTGGKLPRTFCIWDPIGKAGPIATAAKDQVLRSLHYGMQLTIDVFQNEQEMVETFASKKACDAILVRGATAQRFNRFLATTEAPGALPDRQHLQLLAQVLAKPEIAEHMTNAQYTALGLVTIGYSRLYADSAAKASLNSLDGKSVSVADTDTGFVRLVDTLRGRTRTADMPATVKTFTNELTEFMIAPDISYLAMANGRTGKETRGLAMPLGQSTLQLIGHSDRFPPGLAQILREDFLFKFNSYARMLDKELGNIPTSFWINPSSADMATLNENAQQIRLTLRNEGYYDPVMLRLARKIRCRFSPDESECKNPVE
ncbi:hypothetical protein SAMN05421686_103273 [Thalassolituus maritimus]|uniref:Uncharacterized protein n=1 Tax=Thalassolituus maritimus TaxID=484498 RepID=A0A1N7L411_9GAMM|nr:putative solute-binding protein [Thalassolituus maritimus]SIS68543.1 hypothetical protein SAMN05421686_103273 [Thalassolituus maritimus]